MSTGTAQRVNVDTATRLGGKAAEAARRRKCPGDEHSHVVAVAHIYYLPAESGLPCEGVYILPYVFHTSLK